MKIVIDQNLIQTINRRGNPEFIKSDIKLTIGMLVSNHIQYFRKGLESIKPLLDAVPSELIIVDTVGPENSDGSLDLAKKYTDKIYHYDWNDNFSEARNVAMDHAKGEWFMYFDDDEYFDDVTEFIDFFKSGECDIYKFGMYYTGDYDTPTHYDKGVAGRMIRRTANTKFVGYVHENFNERFKPTKQFNAFTHHFGYLYQTPEQQRAKMDRNMKLLERELKENGPSAKVCTQIVAQLKGDTPEEANKKCTEYIHALEGTGELENSCGQWLLVASVLLVENWGFIDGVLAIEKNLLEKYKLQETARLVLAHKVASVAYDAQAYDIAADRVKAYFKNLEWLNTHPEERAIQAQLDTSSFMMGDKLYMITMIGAISEFNLKHFEEAYAYIKKINLDYCNDINETKKLREITVLNLEDPKPAKEWYGRFFKEEFFKEPKQRKYLPENVRNKLWQV
ncbi:MAG: glycosyltransferase [Lachnospiraceae bacterium]|nr:glycosyltransferase [Lachnospiraceae bacterium]